MKQEWRLHIFYTVTICAVILSAYLGGRTVSVFAENQPYKRTNCMIIDPGHGGEDGGAISCTGKPESTYNLDFAVRLQDLFHLLGYETKMIRTSDISVYTRGDTLAQKKISDLKERVRIVNETEGAFLLSIHQNHYQDPQYYGAQVFYAQTKDSEIFAKQLQADLVTTVNPNNKRQAKKSSGVYLMEHITCPAVLIECGFLSNAEEERRLAEPEYQKKMCSVIAASVCRYLSNT